MENIKTVVADLTDWSKAYPTGAVAYDNSDSVIDSAYCDETDEFAEFFKEHNEAINEDTKLIFKIDSEDFGTPKLEELVSSIQDAFKGIYSEGENNNV